MLERIKKLLNSEGLNYGSFADEIGVQRSSLSHILNGRNNPSLDFTVKTLLRFPKVNPDWFILGKGEMYKDMQIEEEPIIDLNHNESNRESGLTHDLFSTTSKEPIMDEPSLPTIEKAEVPVNEDLRPLSTERYVSQILIFYSDSTYQVYKPEKLG